MYRNQRNRAVPKISAPANTTYRSEEEQTGLDKQRSNFLGLQRHVDQIQQQLQQLLTLHEQQQKSQKQMQQLRSQRPLAVQCYSN
jgi:uncharacterized phage infection (PIP) family protein YhgE